MEISPGEDICLLITYQRLVVRVSYQPGNSTRFIQRKRPVNFKFLLLNILTGLCISLFHFSALGAEQPEVKVRITLEDSELLKNVKAHLSIVQETKKPPLLDRINPFHQAEPARPLTNSRIKRLHHRAPGEIRQALQPFGYYEPVIVSELKQKGDNWKARYTIEPGPATIIKTIDIEVTGAGASDPALQNIIDKSNLIQDIQLSHETYENTKKALYDSAYFRGYLDAHFTKSELSVIPEQQRADILLHFDTGDQYFFGPINLEQSVIKQDLAKRFINIQTGDPLETDKLLDLQLRLDDSDYYSHVEIDLQRDKATDNKVPVLIKTGPSKSERYSIGLGYGTDTGPRLTLGTKFRHLNRRGHQFQSDLQWSEVKQTFSLQYLVPIGKQLTDQLAFSAALQEEQFGDINTRQLIIGPSHITNWRGFRRRLYLNFLQEDFSFDRGIADRSDILYPGITLSRKSANNPTFPRKGYSIIADIHGASDSLLSSSSFLRASLDLRGVISLGKRSRLLMHVETGGIVSDAFDLLPPSQRFFTGGDRSLRGYSYQDVGPTNNLGDTIGGKNLLTGSIEIDHLFYKSFGVALFFDTGDAFNDAPDLLKSVGIGLRWRSPVGMFRIDLAHPMDDPDSNFRLHISIGPDL